MGYIPTRKCISCGIKKNKYEFIKLVKNAKNEIDIDETGKREGRGAYICNTVECFERAYKFRKIEKSFKINVDNEVYERLKGIIIGKE